MNLQIVIFTDLDGSFLDHNTYSYAEAKPCLAYLNKQCIPLIFTSSKTAVEINNLCEKTNTQHPFIAENGGLLSIPKNYFSAHQPTLGIYEKKVIGKTRAEIDYILSTLTSLYKFKTFNDMSTEELTEHTGLDQQQALFASQRDCTEPLLWLDEDIKLKLFKSMLAKHGLRLVSGGRFHHVMGNHDKATTMKLLIKKFENLWKKHVISIALGDSPNDLEMLLNADYGILIPNPHAPKTCMGNHATLIHAKKAGPKGWNETLQRLLKELIE